MCKNCHNAHTRMVAVCMVLVLDTLYTIAARRAAEGSKSPWIPLDNKAFLGSTCLEDPPAPFRRQPATGLDRLPGDRPDGFVAWTARCLKRSFLPDAAGKASFRCGPARVKVPCGSGTCARIKIFQFGAGIQKTKITSDRLFLTSTTHIFYSCINLQISLIYISRS